MIEPWIYDAHVRAGVTRSKDGNITATLKIDAANGGPPFMLSATMPEGVLMEVAKAAHGMASNYHDFLHAQDPVASGMIPAALSIALGRKYNRLKARPGMIAMLQKQTATAANLVRAARRGDKRAKRLIRILSILAARGDRRAQRGRAALAGCAADPALAGAGCVGEYYAATSGAHSIFQHAPAMDLHNYYQIVSGWGVSPESAGYTPETLSFPGVEGVWENLRPRLGIRPEGSGFGVRDALRLGMRSIVHRELAAA